ncbi:putative dinucleotide-binding enzyme [Streptacidiphilus sp. MAP12-16]
MKVSIVGTGHIGSVLARLLVGAGHQVLLANARGPQSLAPLVAELGPAAEAREAEAAAREGDLVVLMVPFGQVKDLFAADAVAGKVLVDATNAYGAGGGRGAGAGPSSSELVAAWYPGARVVKALNTMNFKTLGASAMRSGDARLAHYVAGDDQAAKDQVATLIESLGFVVVDTGALHGGSVRQQPGSAVYNHPLTAEQAHAALRADAPH